MNSRRSKQESASSSRPASRVGSKPVGVRGSQGAPRCWRQQLAADQVEVGQREEAEGARQVLGNAAIPDLGKPPQPLDDVERVLAAGAGPRPRPIDRAPACRQWPMGGGGSPELTAWVDRLGIAPSRSRSRPELRWRFAALACSRRQCPGDACALVFPPKITAEPSCC